MTLEIRFKNAGDVFAWDDDPETGEGEIRLRDELREGFLSITIGWQPSDYRRSWTSNLEKARDGQDAFLATDIPPPALASIFTVWPLFWVDGDAFMTEKLLIRSNYDFDFTIENIARMIDFEDLKVTVRRMVASGTVGTNDAEISTWRVFPTDLGSTG